MKKLHACGSMEHEIARRQFLGGMMAGGAMIGGLSSFYTQEALAGLSKQQKRMIVVRMAGGLSQLESWDPKPNTDTGGPFRAIKTSVPGLHISELLPFTAKQMHHLCLVRGINTRNGVRFLFDNQWYGESLGSEVDFVVHGEGEYTISELVGAFERGDDDYSSIHGISYLDPDGEVRKTPVRPVIADLDSLPYPAWNLFPYTRYGLLPFADVAHPVLSMTGSRGCPYRCEFCLSSLDKKVRTFPLDKLLAAFDDLLARGVCHFKFVDRTFNLNIRISQAILSFFLLKMRPLLLNQILHLQEQILLQFHFLKTLPHLTILSFLLLIIGFIPYLGRCLDCLS